MDAPVQGSGKTLLASCIAALATGRSPEIWPHTAGRDDEEIRKRLFTALRDGTTALIWDNITGVLDSAALASAITAPVLRDRVLGRSESLGIPNRAMLLLTGNNFCPAGDMPRRIITIRIDPGTDAPFARQFDLDPLDYVLEHRIDLAGAALVLIRGWLSSGAPRAAGRMASFEAWDDLVRQTVCWIGRGDRARRVRRPARSRPPGAGQRSRAGEPLRACWRRSTNVFARPLVHGEGRLRNARRADADRHLRHRRRNLAGGGAGRHRRRTRR